MYNEVLPVLSCENSILLDAQIKNTPNGIGN